MYKHQQSSRCLSKTIPIFTIMKKIWKERKKEKVKKEKEKGKERKKKNRRKIEEEKKKKKEPTGTLLCFGFPIGLCSGRVCRPFDCRFCRFRALILHRLPEPRVFKGF